MAHQALGRVLARGSVGAEAWTVRAHAPAKGGVARRAVALHVARRAGLQSLTRGPPVLKEPLGLRRVERGVEPAFCAETRLSVATAAEELCIVARGAVRFATVRLRRVGLHEIRPVKAPRVFGRVTVGAEPTLVAAGARQGSVGCLRSVSGAKVRVMHTYGRRFQPSCVLARLHEWCRRSHARRLQSQLHACCTARFRHGHQAQHVGRTGAKVARRTGWSRVAGATAFGPLSRGGAVASPEALDLMVSWQRVRGRAIGHDRRHPRVAT